MAVMPGHEGHDGRGLKVYRAARDFFLFQNLGYPRDAALDWVGNRFTLGRTDRDLLRRGVFAENLAERHRAKRVCGARWREKPLWVDGHNVHITVESLLLGRPLVLANDGALRDVAALSRSYKPTAVTEAALTAVVRFLKTFPPRAVHFLFDAPMSRSGELAARYREALRHLGLSGEVRAVAVPEKHFPLSGAVIASSDQAVVDACAQWLDLARWIMDFQGLAFFGYDFRSLLASKAVVW
ncbi:DUF434 domain-containing protein [Desulfosoma sp.]